MERCNAHGPSWPTSSLTAELVSRRPCCRTRRIQLLDRLVRFLCVPCVGISHRIWNGHLFLDIETSHCHRRSICPCSYSNRPLGYLLGLGHLKRIVSYYFAVLIVLDYAWLTFSCLRLFVIAFTCARIAILILILTFFVLIAFIVRLLRLDSVLASISNVVLVVVDLVCDLLRIVGLIALVNHILLFRSLSSLALEIRKCQLAVVLIVFQD